MFSSTTTEEGEKYTLSKRQPVALRPLSPWDKGRARRHTFISETRDELCDQRPWGISSEAGGRAASVGPRIPRVKSWPRDLSTGELRHVSSLSLGLSFPLWTNGHNSYLPDLQWELKESGDRHLMNIVECKTEAQRLADAN